MENGSCGNSGAEEVIATSLLEISGTKATLFIFAVLNIDTSSRGKGEMVSSTNSANTPGVD